MKNINESSTVLGKKNATWFRANSFQSIADSSILKEKRIRLDDNVGGRRPESREVLLFFFNKSIFTIYNLYVQQVNLVTR